MTEPNTPTGSLRQDLTEWISDHYPAALTALDDADPTLFAGNIPEWEVRPYRARLTEELECFLIDIRLEQCGRGTTAGNRRTHTVTLHLVSPRDDELSQDLDAMLSALLDTLTTTSRGLNWTTAEYAIRDEGFPAYQITLNLEEVS